MQRRFAIAILNAKLTLFCAIFNQFVFKINNCFLKCFDTFKTCLVSKCIFEQTALRMSLLGCNSISLLTLTIAGDSNSWDIANYFEGVNTFRAASEDAQVSRH